MSVQLPRPFIPRKAIELAIRRMDAARVVIINGPRQSGKTSVLGVLESTCGGTYLSLDVIANLRSARTDPNGFVAGFEAPLYIDEVQRGGDPLVLAIKFAVDSSPRRGQFVLAGSTRFLTEPRLSESLAGRVRFVDLWPLSQGEIAQTSDRFVDVVMDNPGQLLKHQPPQLTRRQVFERVCRGGFPEAVLSETEIARREFLADYSRTVTTKDVQELSSVGHAHSFRKIVNLIAARTATELNIADLGRELGLAAPTLRRYLPLLETIYVHHVVPAWSRNLTARVIKRPKIHMVDSGLAAFLIGSDPAGLARPTATHAGQLLETFVAGELARQITWSENQATLYHWRDRGGAEVDLILETPDGRIAGVEVKAAVDVGEDDFRWLRLLQRKLGDQFVAGVVVHCGERPLPFGPRMYAVPVSTIWTV